MKMRVRPCTKITSGKLATLVASTSRRRLVASGGRLGEAFPKCDV